MRKLLTILVLIFTLVPKSVFAAGLVSSFQISDPKAVNGDILSMSNQGLVRSTTDYDMRVFGVLTATAEVVLRSSDPTFKPVVQTGTVLVNVTNVNGAIKQGDYVTTSAKNPGKGQKATISGYVLGTAMEDLNGASGQISVTVNPTYAEISNARTLSRLLDYFTAGLFKNISDQGQFPVVMRYIIAGLIMLISIVISFFTFSRSVPKAIEAIGRNPLARGSIMLSLAMSIGLVIATLAIGLIASVVILKL